MPPLERLNELLEVVEIPPDKYGEWSGLVWKVDPARAVKKGSVAGCRLHSKRDNGRFNWVVRVDGVLYYATRIIYFMTHKKNPGDFQVDHEDKNWMNNNGWNLRLDVNGDIQPINRGIQSNNTSGITGVSWRKEKMKWRARAEVKNKSIHLGYFTCKIAAAYAINEKWKELGWLELGRKLNDLSQISCDCSKCSARDDRPT